MDSNEYENNHLIELGDSDYEIVDGEPDIMGWEVKNQQGQKIGDVDELLFDKETRKVRYIIVDLDDNELELDVDKKVLIPIGIAEIYSEDEAEDEEAEEEGSEDESEGTIEGNESVLEKDDHDLNDFDKDEADKTVVGDHSVDTETDEDEEEDKDIYDPAEDGDVVIVPVSIEQLNQLPAYDKDNVIAESESEIRRVFEGGLSETSPAIPYNKEDFYAHEHFNENKFYNRTEEPITPLLTSAESIEPEIGETSASRIGFGETENHQTETAEKDFSDFQLPKTDEEEGLEDSESEKPVF